MFINNVLDTAYVFMIDVTVIVEIHLVTTCPWEGTSSIYVPAELRTVESFKGIVISFSTEFIKYNSYLFINLN